MYVYHVHDWCPWRSAVPLKLELQIVVKQFVVLGIKPLTSVTAKSALQINIRILQYVRQVFSEHIK